MSQCGGSSGCRLFLQVRRQPLALLLGQLLATGLIQAERADEAPPSLADSTSCKQLKIMKIMHNTESACFCYIPNGTMYLQNTWSSIQVFTNSTGLFQVVYIPDERDCQNSEHLLDFLKCLISNIWQPSMSNQTLITVDQYVGKTCFRIEPTNKILYTVRVQQKMLDSKLVLLFVAGGLLFHFAYNLSRSNIFYYSAGIAFGIFIPLVFLVFMLKRFIPKLSTFWILMSGCWFSSLYMFYVSREKLKWMWNNSTYYILGYILSVGLISFAICKKHGPLGSQQSMNLLMWMLQLKGLILIYFGIAIPWVAYAVITAMLCTKLLHYPLRASCYIGKKAAQYFHPENLETRYLTEDEYREQGETETVKALEELRIFCRNPTFPSWVAVVKLQSPQKFASFVLGSPHVSAEETTAHEAQYGIGGALLEQQLFQPETEAELEPHNASAEVEERNKEEGLRLLQPNLRHFHSREFL
ncbi:nuclear envelope integral membrane protein 2-like [Protobothrops mucrosquamatus]|uniref:nuclear envelope integral membrane protein 2-like n=1 Tax=Protobothrops mucrosquamatus TaxID=103944 RepID=UPI0007758346|nr:nuclear envelope integral membrane protein 2-like [Protobothrops mucrosquamatus]